MHEAHMQLASIDKSFDITGALRRATESRLILAVRLMARCWSKNTHTHTHTIRSIPFAR